MIYTSHTHTCSISVFICIFCGSSVMVSCTLKSPRRARKLHRSTWWWFDSSAHKQIHDNDTISRASGDSYLNTHSFITEALHATLWFAHTAHKQQDACVPATACLPACYCLPVYCRIKLQQLNTN